MKSPSLFVLSAAILLSACASPRNGTEDTWSNRFSDMIDPVVPDSLRLGRRLPPLSPEVRPEPVEFPLSERREVPVVFSVRNTTTKAERLEFSTTQRFDLSVIAPDGRRIYQWSEDRTFDPVVASVVVNPSERIEYEAAVPTRDMQAGGIYRVEAGLTGFPETTASAQIRPR
jgi:hypothetical protein